MAPDTPADGLTAELERLSAIEQAADPGPWTVSARHGIDISDEGWSEVSIVTGGGATVAMTFLSHVLEPDRDDENGAFIVAARTAMPRLVAALSDLLRPHQPGRRVVHGATCDRHEAHRHFSITEPEAAGVRSCPDCKATVYTSCTGCGPGVSVDACPVRVTVARRLNGGTDDA